MHRALQGIRILPAAIFAVAASLLLALPVRAQSDDAQRRYEEWKAQEKARQEADWRAAVSPLIEQAEPRATDSQVTPALLTPGSSFRDCPECPEMVVIPAGSFTMGSPPHESGRYDDEGPQHRVSVSAFAMGKYEVTFAEWAACVRDGGCNGYRPNDSRWGRGNRPVMNVSWDDAQTYVRWLGRGTGERYRLPSEAEWEYAARAGTATARYWRESAGSGCGYANGADLTAKEQYSGLTVANCRDGYINMAPVGSFRANGFGLHDVLGNVREWLEDCWHGSYADAPTDGSAWITGGSCAKRVLRGGSWIIDPRDLRSADRARNLTDFRNNYNGFRVARTLTSESTDLSLFGTVRESPDEFELTRKVVCEVPGKGQVVIIYSSCLYHNGRVIREPEVTTAPTEPAQQHLEAPHKQLEEAERQKRQAGQTEDQTPPPPLVTYETPDPEIAKRVLAEVGKRMSRGVQWGQGTLTGEQIGASRGAKPVNPAYSNLKRNKAITVCVAWESSTIDFINLRTLGFSHYYGNIGTAREGSMWSCEKSKAKKYIGNCECQILIENDNLVLEVPKSFLTRISTNLRPVIPSREDGGTTKWGGVISGGGCSSFSIEMAIDKDGGIVGEAMHHATGTMWAVSGMVGKSNFVNMRIEDVGDVARSQAVGKVPWLTLAGHLTGSSLSIAQPSSRSCDPPRSGALKRL